MPRSSPRPIWVASSAAKFPYFLLRAIFAVRQGMFPVNATMGGLRLLWFGTSGGTGFQPARPSSELLRHTYHSESDLACQSHLRIKEAPRRLTCGSRRGALYQANWTLVGS